MNAIRIARAAAHVRPAVSRLSQQRRGYADAVSDKIKLTLALPHQSIYKSTDVVQVNIPAESGEMGVLANHVPSIEQLKPGLVEIIEESGGSKQFFLSGGFAIVQPGSQLSINAVEGFPLEDFSSDAVRSQITEAQKIAGGSGSEQDIAEAKIELEASMYIVIAEAMGPVVEEGFVAARVRALQGAYREPWIPYQSQSPTTPRPLLERAQKFESCSLPKSRGTSVRSTNSPQAITTENNTRQSKTRSLDGWKRIKPSPSSYAHPTSSAAVQAQDGKNDSLRSPNLQDQLYYPRIRRPCIDYKVMNEGSSLGQKNPIEREIHSALGTIYPRNYNTRGLQREEWKDPTPVDRSPSNGNTKAQEQARVPRQSVAEELGAMINNALEGRYELGADVSHGSHAPGSDCNRVTSENTKRVEPQVQYNMALPAANDPPSSTSESLAPLQTFTADDGSTSSEDGPGPSKHQSCYVDNLRRDDRTRTLPRSSTEGGYYSTNASSTPSRRYRASTMHVQHPSNDTLQSTKLQSASSSGVAARSNPGNDDHNPAASPIEEPTTPKQDLDYFPPVVDISQPSIPKTPKSSSRQYSGTGPKAMSVRSGRSLRSTSSVSGKKWRWWKLVLVDKQPQVQDLRQRISTPTLSRYGIPMVQKPESAAPYHGNPVMIGSEVTHLLAEHVDEDEDQQEREEVTSPEMRNTIPEIKGKVTGEISTHNSVYGSSAGTRTGTRPSSTNGSRNAGSRAKGEGIKRVKVIVSLDGTADLVVEASLQRKRRKSFS